MTTRHPAGQATPRWTLLLQPRWIAWHSMVWGATVGMFFLGDWQLHRAESGNELSWAYTFEWPLFAAFTVFFWVKSLRDELRVGGAAGSAESEPGRAAAGSGADLTAAAGSAVITTAETQSASASAASITGEAGAAPTARSASSGRRADTWDATSWDATSWDATRSGADADGAGKPVDISRATPADGEAYLARLRAEVQHSGRRARR